MSLNNSQLHGFAFVGTIIVSTVLFGGTLYLTEAVEATREPPLKEMITIEASLARKAEKKKQPQKEVKAPPPEVKPEGVSRDETKVPEKKDDKKDEKKPPRKDDKLPDLKDFKHATDDEPTGKPVTDIGQFDGSKEGFAPINAGNPFWQHLAADFHSAWEIPQISKVSGAAVGCIHLESDGRITDVKFKASGDETLDDSVERAIKTTRKARNDKPQPVPTEQLGVIKSWVCFRFDPNQP